MSGPIPPPPSIITANGSRIIVSGTPTLGQVPIADGANTAHWGPAGGGVAGSTHCFLRGGLAAAPPIGGRQQLHLTGAGVPFSTIDRDNNLSGTIGPNILQNPAGSYVSPIGAAWHLDFGFDVNGWYDLALTFNIASRSVILPTSALRVELRCSNGEPWDFEVPLSVGGLHSGWVFTGRKPMFFEPAFADPRSGYYSMQFTELSFATPGGGAADTQTTVTTHSELASYMDVTIAKVG